MGGGGPAVAAGSASQLSTLQNLVKPFVGAGILALPSAFKQGGVLASAILMVTLAIGTNYCIRCLLHCVDYVHARENGLEYDSKTGKFSVAQAEQPEEDPDNSRTAAVRSNGHASLNGDSKAGRNGLGLGAVPDTAARGSPFEREDSIAEPSGNSRSNGSITHRNSNGDRPASPSLIALASPKPLSPSSSAAPAAPVVSTTLVVPNPGTPAVAGGHPERESGARLSPSHLQPGVSGAAEHADPTQAPPVYSFRQIGHFAYGRWGTLAVDVNLVASQLGFCIAYMSFISQNMDELTPGLSRVGWLAVLFGSWSVLCQVRSIERIAFTSALGNLVYAVSLGIIFYDGFKNSCCVGPSDAVYVRPQGLAVVFGTGCFALEGIGLVLPVKRAMKDQSAFSRILNVAVGIVAFVYVLFGVLGYLFYGAHVHSLITDNLTKGPLSDAVRISLSLSLFMSYIIQMFPVTDMADKLWDDHVFFKGARPDEHGTERGGEGDTYRSLADEQRDEDRDAIADSGNGAAPSPVSQHHAATAGVNYLSTANSSSSRKLGNGSGAVHKPLSQSEEDPSSDPTWPGSPLALGSRHGTNWRREAALILTRVLLVAFTAGVSWAFKNFGDIVSLVGSFSNSAIAFILPMMFFIRLVLQHPERDEAAWAAHYSPSWWTRNKSRMLPVTIIVLGVAASIIGVTTTIQGMIDPPKDDD